MRSRTPSTTGIAIFSIVIAVALIGLTGMLLVQKQGGYGVLGNLVGKSAYDSPNGLRGFLDITTAGRLAGWSYDVDRASEPVTIDIYDNDVLVRTIQTDIVRPDVNNAFGIEGAHGFDIPLSLVPGRHRLELRARSSDKVTNLGAYWTTPTITHLSNNAAFVRQTVPSTLQPGESATVSVTMRNTGATTWTATGNYRLGSQNPQDNGIWGTGRAYLPEGVSVASGQEYTFTFQIMAPQQPGMYSSQWRMLREMVEWFGEPTSNAQVPVGGQLNGHVDIFNATHIVGWAYDPQSPELSIAAEISVDGVVVATVPADGARGDVNAAFNIPGNHQFYHTMALPMGPHDVIVTAVNGAKRTELRRGTIIGEACNESFTYHIVSDSATRIVPSGAAVDTWTHGAWAPVTQQFPTARWIWSSNKVQNPVTGEVVRFERKFAGPGTARKATLRITADNAYVVYLNGALVGSAQLSSGWDENNLVSHTLQGWDSIETWDVTGLLGSENTLLILGVNAASGPAATPETNPAGVIFDLEVEADRACGAQVCGDGAIEPPEQCDDGNAHSGDGCSGTCQLETPTMDVSLWEYAGGAQASTLCVGTAQSDLCQTTYPQTSDRYLYMRNDKLMQYMTKNETRGVMGILRDGDFDGGAGMPEGVPWTRCLSDAPGRCDAAVTPYRSMPVHTALPVLSASDVRTNHVTSKGKPFTLKGVAYVNGYDTSTCTPHPTAAGNFTFSTNFFILDSYDFGGDLGVQQNVLVFEGVGPVMPVNNPNPWGAMTIERYWFVKGKGVVREEGYGDQDCLDSPSVHTCNGVFMTPRPGTTTWKHVRSTLMPKAETCPICPPGQPGCGEQRTISTWEYITGDASKRMCVPENQNFCFTRAQPAPDRSMNRRTDSTMGVFIRTPTHTGVFKDGAFEGAGAPWLRCFGDAPGTCEAAHPPFQLPHTLVVPVLPSSALDVNRITAGGTRVKTFASFSIYPINPTTCQVSAASAGSISASAQAFLLESYDFGGNLGVQTDVLVYEDVAGFLPEATNPWGGLVLERYFLVKGLGHVGEEARIDPDCQAAQSTTTCNGVFNQTISGFARWSIHKTPPLPVFESCAPGATGAAFVSQSAPNVMEPGKKYNVSITMRNTGGAIWNASQNYKLGSQNPQDNGIWGLGRVHLSPTERILPGETKTFTFEVTAPNVPGMYSFQWQMLQEMVTWFGEKSPPLAISVNPSGSQTWTFGATDQQDGTFFGPNDIAIMPDGRIVVSDWVNQQVQVFSPTFQFLTRFGKPGGGEQENNDMLSVAVSHDGRIFSADIFSAVKEFGNDYQFIRRHNFASGAEDDPNFRRFNFPHLSFDRTTQDNYIYVADQNNNRVLRLTRMGDGSLGDMRIFRGVNNEIRTPGDVAIITVGGQKRMYVSNGDNTVRVYRDPFGTPQLLATLSGTFTRAGSVAVSPANDRLYVSDDVGNRIHIFALETLTYLMPFGSKGTGDGQFDSPQGIAVDAAGNLYVTESGNNRIQKFTSEGAFLAKFGSRNPLANGKLHRAGSTAYDSIADELYVGDIYNCRIQVFDEQGNFRRAFGQCAKTFNTGGEYHGPDLSYIGDFDIDPSAGRVYIADSFNQRIAVYRIRDGAFLFSFGSAGRGPGQFDNPLMLEVANGKIYVGDWGDLMDGQLDGRVQVFTLNGQYTGLLAANGRGEGQVNQPVGIFDDPRNGRIFVSDAHHYTNIYGSDGQYRQRFRIIDEQTGIPVHGDGFIEQDGDMWLTTGSDRIERWNADNLTRISTYGTHGSGVGQFRYPSKPSPGLNGEMYIGDWNDKVTVYRPS